MRLFYTPTEKNRVVLNLGGMANITILPADDNQAVYGYDTGCDVSTDAASENLQQAYDKWCMGSKWQG